MKQAHFVRISKFALIFMIVSLDCSGQTLADFARKERERQKQLQSTVTVVSGVAGATAVTSAGTAATTPAVVTPPPASTAAQKPAGPLDNQGRDEKYWRDTFLKARDTLKRAEEKAQLMDLRVKELNTQLVQNSAVYNREYRLLPEITAAQKESDTARKQVELAKQRLLELEDELRRAGGPPGWAR